MKVFITGTSRGIGFALAQALTDQGDHVYGIARTQGSYVHKTIDLSSFSERESLLNNLESMPPFDAYVFSAAMGNFWSFHALKYTDMAAQIEVNLLANIHLLSAILPKLPNWTRCIFLGSRASRKFFTHGAVYQASKFWLRGFIGALRREYPHLFFYLVHPHIVNTGFFPRGEWVLKDTPISEVVETIISLIKNEDCPGKEGWKFPFEIEI